MAAEELLNETGTIAEQIILQLGSIGLWFQAIGLIFVMWVIFQIINWVLNRRRIKRLDKLLENLERIETKIDKLLKNK